MALDLLIRGGAIVDGSGRGVHTGAIAGEMVAGFGKEIRAWL